MPPTPNKPDPNKKDPNKAVPPGKVPPKGDGKAPAGKKPEGKKPESKPKSWTGGDATNRKFGQVLVDLGYLDEAQLDELLFDARSTDSGLEQLVLDRGLVSTEQILQAKAEQFGLKVVNLEDAKPTAEVLKLVQENMAQVYKILPLSYENDVLTVVMADPSNLSAAGRSAELPRREDGDGGPGAQYQIDEASKTAYSGKPQESIIDLLKTLEDTKVGGRQRESSIDLGDLMEIADSAPVRKLINMILLTAIRDRASDIHFEPFEEEYKVRRAATAC